MGIRRQEVKELMNRQEYLLVLVLTSFVLLGYVWTNRRINKQKKERAVEWIEGWEMCMLGGSCSCTPLQGVFGMDGQTVLERMSSGLSTWPAHFCLSQNYLCNTSGQRWDSSIQTGRKGMHPTVLYKLYMLGLPDSPWSCFSVWQHWNMNTTSTHRCG